MIRGRISRLVARTKMLLMALSTFARRAKARPVSPRCILVVSRFLLGDSLMLAPLFAALRAQYPAASLILAVQPKLLSLFALHPYGVTALPLDLDEAESLHRLREYGPFDLAVVPGDNRHALVARALGARWIVAIEGDRPEWKNLICDQLLPLPEGPGTIYDAFMVLAGPDQGLCYRSGDWAVPESPCAVPNLTRPYVILHVGSSSVGRRWPTELWRELADKLGAEGFGICWSAGPGEESIAREVDPEGKYVDTSGRYDLLQLWNLLENAALLVSADTGVVHMAKLNGCAAVCLYGPGGEALVGKGRFFRDAAIHGVVVPQFRDRRDGRVFKRQMPWARGWKGAPADEDRPGPEMQLRSVFNSALSLLAAQTKS